jgi:hypothetical protein
MTIRVYERMESEINGVHPVRRFGASQYSKMALFNPGKQRNQHQYCGGAVYTDAR